MEHTTSATKFIGFTTVAAIMGLGFALAMGASADVGVRGTAGASFVRHQCTSERRAEIEEAITNRDYGAWATLMEGKGRITHAVTPHNFEIYVQMHEAMQEGAYEEAGELRKELGLGNRFREAPGGGREYGKGGGWKHDVRE